MTRNTSKVCRVLILFLISISLFSQTEREINSKIDSIKKVIKSNEKKITALEKQNKNYEKEIEELNTQLIELKYKNMSDKKLVCFCTTMVYKYANLLSTLGELSVGDEIEPIGEENTYYKFKYNRKIAYVFKSSFCYPSEFASKVEEYEAYNSYHSRKNVLIRKYGQTMGTRIYHEKVSLGMTKQMVIDSIGRPKDINKSVGSWGVHEQWIYPNNRYLYFENGKLTSWQK